jgi:hypothetical protein
MIRWVRLQAVLVVVIIKKRENGGGMAPEKNKTKNTHAHHRSLIDH